MAKCTGRGIRAGQPYEVMGLANDHVTVRHAKGDEEAAESPLCEEESGPNLARKESFRNFSLHYARTYASIQGITVSWLIALHGTSHCHFDRRHLFVGVSRAVSSDKLIVY